MKAFTVISVGTRLYGRRVTDGAVVCATVAEIFVDDNEAFHIAISRKFSDSTDTEFYFDKDLTQKCDVSPPLARDKEQLQGLGMIPIQISEETEVETSTNEFTDQIPGPLSPVSSTHFTGFVSSPPKPISLNGRMTRAIYPLVEFQKSDTDDPIVGDLCFTNGRAWGAVIAISQQRSVVAVVPFWEVYKEFAKLGLEVAPSSEVERRRLLQAEGNLACQNPAIAAVFTLISDLIEDAGLEPERHFVEFSSDDLLQKIRIVSLHCTTASVVAHPPEIFGIGEGEEAVLNEFLQPGGLLSQVHLNTLTSQFIHEVDDGQLNDFPSVADLISCSLTILDAA